MQFHASCNNFGDGQKTETLTAVNQWYFTELKLKLKLKYM